MLIGLSIMLRRFTSINFSNVKAQEYGRCDDDDDGYIQFSTEINKYECRTGPLKAFLYLRVEFVNMLNLMILKETIEIIEQEHKAHLVHKVLLVYQVHKVKED